LPCSHSRTTSCACLVCSPSWCWTEGVAGPAGGRSKRVVVWGARDSDFFPCPIEYPHAFGGIPQLICMSKTLPCTSVTSQALPLVLWTPIRVSSFCMEHSKHATGIHRDTINKGSLVVSLSILFSISPDSYGKALSKHVWHLLDSIAFFDPFCVAHKIFRNFLEEKIK
jgi:hypothetical protein